MEEEKRSTNRKLTLNIHKCESCAFRTKSSGIIRSHGRKHQQETKANRFSCESSDLEPFECHFCDFQNNFKVAVDRHENLVHRGHCPDPQIDLKCYECDKCAFTTYSILIFFRHICVNAFLKHDRRYETTLKNNANNFQRTKRSYTRSAIKRLECDQCPYIGKTTHLLKKHIVWKHLKPEEIDWFECKKCPFKAKLKDNLNKHVYLRHEDPNKIKWFHCDKCSYKAKLKNRLQRHFLMKHSRPEEIKWYECEHCFFQAKLKFNLKQHVRKVHLAPKQPKELKPFECGHCSVRLKNKSSLLKHIGRKHKPRASSTRASSTRASSNRADVTFECQVCGKKKGSQKGLKEHVVTAHSDRVTVKLYECQICSYKTDSQNTLKRHIVSTQHYQDDSDDSEWFECKKCSYKGKLGRHLRRHMRRMHSGIKRRN